MRTRDRRFFGANRNSHSLSTALSSCLDGEPAGLKRPMRTGGYNPTLTAADRPGTTAVLRRFLQFNDGQILAPGQIRDAQAEELTASSSNGSLRSGTWRTPRPSSSWLNARCAAGRPVIEVDLVRSSSIEGAMRPMAVVPLDEQREFAPESRAVIGNDELARALVLDGPNQSFDNRETAIFLDGPESLVDTTSATPAPESTVGELPAVVGDQVTRTGMCRANGPAEEGSDSRGGRLLLEHRETVNSTPIFTPSWTLIFTPPVPAV